MLKFLTKTTPKGNEKINGAINLFTNALTELNEGIELSKSEVATIQEEIVVKEQKWEDTKLALNKNISDTTADIKKANAIKSCNEI